MVASWRCGGVSGRGMRAGAGRFEDLAEACTERERNRLRERQRQRQRQSVTDFDVVT